MKPLLLRSQQQFIIFFYTGLQKVPSRTVTAKRLETFFLGQRGRHRRATTYQTPYYDVVLVFDASNSIRKRDFPKGIKALETLIDKANPNTHYAAIVSKQPSPLISPILKLPSAISTPRCVSSATRQTPKTHSLNAGQSSFKTKTLIYVHEPKNAFSSSLMELPTCTSTSLCTEHFNWKSLAWKFLWSVLEITCLVYKSWLVLLAAQTGTCIVWGTPCHYWTLPG